MPMSGPSTGLFLSKPPASGDGLDRIEKPVRLGGARAPPHRRPGGHGGSTGCTTPAPPPRAVKHHVGRRRRSRRKGPIKGRLGAGLVFPSWERRKEHRIRPVTPT